METKMLTNKKHRSRNKPKLQIGKQKFRKISGPDRAGNLKSFYDRILEADCSDIVYSYVQANTTIEQKQS